MLTVLSHLDHNGTSFNFCFMVELRINHKRFFFSWGDLSQLIMMMIPQLLPLVGGFLLLLTSDSSWLGRERKSLKDLKVGDWLILVFYHTQLMILPGDIILLWVWSIELICLLLLQLWFVQLWYQQATEDTFVYIFFFSNLHFAGLGNKLHLDCCIRGGFDSSNSGFELFFYCCNNSTSFELLLSSFFGICGRFV